MADVILEGNKLVVICRGQRRNTGVMIDPTQPGKIEDAVKKAISAASMYFYGAGDDARGAEAEKINVARATASIRRKLSPGEEVPEKKAERPAHPPREPEEKKKPHKAERVPRPREERAEETREEKAEERKETKKATPRPLISQEWIEQQLRDASKNDRKAQDAASAVHTSRAYVDMFLTPNITRAAERTENQKNATIALFNSLSAVPGFRLYLTAIAAQQQQFEKKDRVFPEFEMLQTFLSEPGRSEMLTRDANPQVISSADMYIRHYLYNFVALIDDYSGYKKEIEQLPSAKWRLDRISKSKDLPDAQKNASIRQMLTGPLDADTLVMAVLYLRRWTLEHPEEGNAKTQAQISLWTAPQVLASEEEARKPVVPIRPPAQKTALEEFAEKNWKNLSEDMHMAAKNAKPEALITIMRALPPGQSSLESALSALKRNDITRAFEKVFNDMLSSDPKFRAFLEYEDKYNKLASIRLDEKASPQTRVEAARAVQDFLNNEARKEDPLHSKMKEDLKILYRQVLRPPTGRDELFVNGLIDGRTLAAVAVHEWRKKNPRADIGEWAKQFGAGVQAKEATPEEDKYRIKF